MTMEDFLEKLHADCVNAVAEAKAVHESENARSEALERNEKEAEVRERLQDELPNLLAEAIGKDGGDYASISFADDYQRGYAHDLLKDRFKIDAQGVYIHVYLDSLVIGGPSDELGDPDDCSEEIDEGEVGEYDAEPIREEVRRALRGETMPAPSSTTTVVQGDPTPDMRPMGPGSHALADAIDSPENGG